MNDASTSFPETGHLCRAWWRWSLLTAGCVVGLIVVLPWADVLQINEKAWLIAPILWLLLAVPATLGVYGHYFGEKAGEAKTAADSADYLRGVTSVWTVLTFGVGLSLLACLLGGSATPAIWPGALMLMLLILARPTASAPKAQATP